MRDSHNNCIIFRKTDASLTDIDPVFFIPMEYCEKIIRELFQNKEYKSIDEFFKSYIPEVEGEQIYQRAKLDNKIVYEL